MFFESAFMTKGGIQSKKVRFSTLFLKCVKWPDSSRKKIFPKFVYIFFSFFYLEYLSKVHRNKTWNIEHYFDILLIEIVRASQPLKKKNILLLK